LAPTVKLGGKNEHNARQLVARKEADNVVNAAETTMAASKLQKDAGSPRFKLLGTSTVWTGLKLKINPKYNLRVFHLA
jgi:hypothetical protein